MTVKHAVKKVVKEGRHAELDSASSCLNHQNGEIPNQVWNDNDFGCTQNNRILPHEGEGGRSPEEGESKTTVFLMNKKRYPLIRTLATFSPA